MAAEPRFDLVAVAEELDVFPAELRRQLGTSATAASPSQAARERLAALLEQSDGDDDAIAGLGPDDAARAGALVARLRDAATATVIAGWMGWTTTRTTAVLAELDRRLAPAGLRLHADRHGHLRIRSRIRLRQRPTALATDVLAQLDDPRYRHALAHLVWGDRCSSGDGDLQLVADLGVVINPCSRSPQPHAALAAAFAAATTHHWTPGRSRVIVIDPDPLRR